MKKKLFYAVLTLVVCAGVGTASATSLIDVDGQWTGWTGGVNVTTPSGIANPGYGNQLQNQIRWGVPYQQPFQSGLGFTPFVDDDLGVGPQAITLGTPFEMGELEHFNFEIFTGSNATVADLTLTMDFSNGGTDSVAILLPFSVNETGGTGTPDIIGFPSGNPTQIITLGATDYRFTFVGFGPDADHLEDEFVSAEGFANTTKLFGKLTELPTIPAPGALLLASVGFSIVGYVRRRKML